MCNAPILHGATVSTVLQATWNNCLNSYMEQLSLLCYMEQQSHFWSAHLNARKIATRNSKFHTHNYWKR